MWYQLILRLIINLAHASTMHFHGIQIGPEMEELSITTPPHWERVTLVRFPYLLSPSSASIPHRFRQEQFLVFMRDHTRWVWTADDIFEPRLAPHRHASTNQWWIKIYVLDEAEIVYVNDFPHRLIRYFRPLVILWLELLSHSLHVIHHKIRV